VDVDPGVRGEPVADLHAFVGGGVVFTNAWERFIPFLAFPPTGSCIWDFSSTPSTIAFSGGARYPDDVGGLGLQLGDRWRT
jgi:hypothetical protein